MPLQHGGVDAQQEVNSSLSAEEQRKIKNGLIIAKLRRYWRFACIAFAIITFISYVVTGSLHMGILGDLFYAVVGWLVIYAITTFLFLYIFAYRVLQAFFYLRDLFGGSKETRL